MREETAEQIANALAVVLGIAGGVWLTWCIVVAFIGGTMPIIGVHTEGSFGLGMVWLMFISPVVETILIGLGTLVLMPLMLFVHEE